MDTHPAPCPPVRPVTRAELEQVYGADGLIRVPETDLPTVVTDPGARAFLSGIGLPDAPSAFISPEKPPLPLLSSSYADPATYWSDLPNGGATMVLIGSWGTVFALDGSTGEVYALLPYQEATFDGRPAHRSLHSLIRCQLAFGAQELNLLGDLMDPDTADWCRDHVPGFVELFPVPELDEYGLPVDDEVDPAAPDSDEVIAHLADKLRQIEPDLLRHPGWESVLQHFRHGY